MKISINHIFKNANDIRDRFPVFIAGVILLVFLSCVSMQGTLPKPKTSADTILVIKLNRTGTADIHSDYILYTKEGGMIEVNTKRRYIFRNGLSEGTHTINSVKAVSREYKGFSKVFDTPEISFEIVPGKITVLPYAFQIAMDENTQMHAITELHPTEVTAIKNDLVDYLNFDLWSGFAP